MEEFAATIPGIEQHAFRSFADALDEIPAALAENSGLSFMEEVSHLKKRQRRILVWESIAWELERMI